jgi:hypothetical protein
VKGEGEQLQFEGWRWKKDIRVIRNEMERRAVVPASWPDAAAM